MSISLWCLFAASIWVVLSKAPMNILMARQQSYDNHHPRLQQLQLEPGPAHRAWAAHQNMLEAYPLFAAGVLVSQTLATDSQLSSVFSVSFVLLRLAYQLFYLLDYSTARSISWGLGYFCVLGLLLSPMM